MTDPLFALTEDELDQLLREQGWQDETISRHPRAGQKIALLRHYYKVQTARNLPPQDSERYCLQTISTVVTPEGEWADRAYYAETGLLAAAEAAIKVSAFGQAVRIRNMNTAATITWPGVPRPRTQPEESL